MDEIFVNTEQCRVAARALRQASGGLSDAGSSLTRLLGSAAETWQSKSANVFIEKNAGIEKQINRFKADAEQLAAEIDAAVSGYIEAERRISEETNNR